jgi:ParB/RepB/Spo0J family partition protein
MAKLRTTLKSVKVASIKPNPNNPRGESVRDNDDQFQYLKRSIKEFGLLVPIVVQRSSAKENEFILLDGERRYHAVKELGFDEVPAHILDDSIDIDQGKNLMFHIHTTRLQWDAYQQCKALEPLYDSLYKRFKGNENNVAKQLVLLTGTNQRTLNARLNFLRWPKKIKDVVYDQRPELYYTVVEIEGQIIAPALKNFPLYFETVKVDDVREFLFNKYLRGIIPKATEARKVTQMLSTPPHEKDKHAYALKLFKKLTTNLKFSFENARDEFLAKYPEEDQELDESFHKISLNLKRAITTLSDVNETGISSLNNKNRQKLTALLTELQSLANNILQATEE